MGGQGTAFDQEQFESIYPEGVERHYWNRCRNAVIARMLRGIGASGPILEVGCGKGLVVQALRSEGFDVAGVDIAVVDPVPGASAHVRTGTDAFALAHSEAVRFKTLLLLDVIEHLEHPAEFIQRLRAAFPNVEWIVATVPARQELFSAHDTFNRHFRRYDLPTMRSHMDPDGDGPWRASYFFHSLYPLAWLQARLSDQRRRFSAPTPGFSGSLHAFIGALLALEHRILPGWLWGTSSIAASGKRAAGKQP